MRSETDKGTPLSAMWRNRETVTSFIGGKCSKCGTLQFPKTDICVNPNCNAIGTQEPHAFADMGARIKSYTADRLTYSPDPPACYGMIEFEEGGRVMIDFTDIDAEALKVGQPMQMMFRIKDIDTSRGFRRYYWKAAPVAAKSLGEISHGKGHQGQGRHSRHGLLQVRRALGQGGRQPDGGGLHRGHRRRRHRHQADRRRLALHGHRGAARRQVGHPAGGGAAAAVHSGDAGGELLRQRHRGVPRRGLRRRLRRRRHRARDGRGEAQGHRLRRPAAARARAAQRHGQPQRLGAGQLRPARRGLSRQAQGRPQGPQARDGAHLGQEPRQRRQEPQGAPAQQDHRRHGAQCADGGRAAGPLRLLRRQRRRRLRHRHHARHRPGPRQEGHGVGEGAAGRGVERARGAAQLLGRQLFRHHSRRVQARLPGSRHRAPARAAQPCSRCTTASR